MPHRVITLIKWKLAFLFLLTGGGLLWLRAQGSLDEVTAMVLEQVHSAGSWGGLVFFVLFLAAPLILFPVTLLTFAGGVLFGFPQGWFLVLASATGSAAGTFLIGRYFFRKPVDNAVHADPRYEALDEAVSREGWKIVALSRLSPVLPFALVNYFFGMTGISLRAYVLASAAAMAPGMAAIVYAGSIAGRMAGRLTGFSPVEWFFAGAGITATVLLFWYVSRMARRALHRRGGIAGPEGAGYRRLPS